MSRAKIYTKTGDEGKTRLVDGTLVQKCEAHVEAYGTVDELNSFIGLFKSRLVTFLPAEDEVSQMARSASCAPESLEDEAQIQNRSRFSLLASFLEQVQCHLFNLGSQLGTEKSEVFQKLPGLSMSSLEDMEKMIDQLDQDLPDLKDFILPGGHELASILHICRTICRRAERRTAVLVQNISDSTHPYRLGLVYLNRLSDFFFMAARWTNFHLQQQEVLWKAKR